jgi:hypothetical protein
VIITRLDLSEQKAVRAILKDLETKGIPVDVNADWKIMQQDDGVIEVYVDEG